jgi:hypothetical protein
MGMTVGSVRRRRDKAIRHLRRRLAKHGGFIFPGKSGRPSRIT